MRGFVRWGPAMLHAAFLFALSAQPDLRLAEEPALDTVLRKLGHLGAYALLAVLVAYALQGPSAGRGEPVRWRLALLIVVAYAVSDEIHQAFVPGRGPSALDVGIDSLGGVLGLVAVRAGAARLHDRRHGSAT